MRAVGFRTPGDPRVVEVFDLPAPDAGPGEVRIAVHASAVNPADTLIRMGDVDVSWLPGPHILGMDIAGVIDQVGEGVDEWQVGDRVMSVVSPTRPRGGGHAEHVVVPVGWVAPAPSNVSLIEAATIPMNGLTALWGLEVLGISPGMTVGVTGSTGAFGGYFIQLAKAIGAKVVADALPADEDLVRSFGADHIARRGLDFVPDVREFAPGGVDVLADAALLGEAALGAIADGGIYSSLRSIGERGTKPLPEPSPRGISYRHFNYFQNPHMASSMRQLMRSVEAGDLTPRVAEVIPLEDTWQAHEALQAGGVRGRFVLDFRAAGRSSARSNQ